MPALSGPVLPWAAGQGGLADRPLKTDVVAALAREGTLAVVGAAGGGNSAVCRAGTLRPRQWTEARVDHRPFGDGVTAATAEEPAVRRLTEVHAVDEVIAVDGSDD